MDKSGKWDPGCGGFVGGESALKYAKKGFFGTPSITTWVRGVNQGKLNFLIRGCMTCIY